MFTGLIQKVGTVVRLERGGGSGRLTLRPEAFARAVELGESVSVQGVCLTLVARKDDTWSFDILQETFQKTNLGERRVGDPVNLELALRWGDPLGGHMVSGHVDGTGTVRHVAQLHGGDRQLSVQCAAGLLRDVVPKGSMACDGVSLTAVDVDPEGFTVHIIPHTWEHTSFRSLAAGDHVNLETDMLAKYARAARERGASPAPPSWDALSK